MPKTFVAIVLGFFVASLLLGCNSKPTSVSSNQADQPDSVASVVEPKPDAATQPNALPSDGATAKEVCECFFRLLRNGERTLAEQLLTKPALAAVVDAGLKLEPMGSVDSQVIIRDAVYATSRAKVAQVPCTIRESDGAEQELTWMLRKTNSGWRVAGLIVKEGALPEFLSLENIADVRSIMGTVGDQDSQLSGDNARSAANVRLVSATDEE